MNATKRKKKSARERGFMPIQEVAAGLRSLAAQLVQDNKGRLAKVTLNVYYEEDDQQGDAAHAVAGGSSETTASSH